MSAVLALVLAAAPTLCAEQEAIGAELGRYAGAASDFDAVVARVERELQASLQLGDVAPERRVDAAKQRLGAACALFGTDIDGPAVDRARLMEIYAQPEFARARRRNANAVQRLMSYLNALLFSVVQTSGAQAFSSWARVLVLAGAFAIGVGGTLRALRWVRRRKKADAPAQAAERLELEDPATHFALAEKALGHDGREAIRQGLLCLLSALERQRWARPDRVKTNRELADELPSRGAPAPVHEAVASLVHWYDRTFYSLEPVDEGEARRFLAEIGRVRGMVAA